MRLPFGNGCGHVASKISASVNLPGILQDDKFLHPKTPQPLIKLHGAWNEKGVGVLKKVSKNSVGISMRSERVESCLRIMKVVFATMTLTDFSAKISITRLCETTNMEPSRVKRGLAELRKHKLLGIRRTARPRSKKRLPQPPPKREITTHIVTGRIFKLLKTDKAMKAAQRIKQRVSTKQTAQNLMLDTMIGLNSQRKKSDVIHAAMQEVYKDAVPDPRGRSNKDRMSSLREMLNK